MAFLWRAYDGSLLVVFFDFIGILVYQVETFSAETILSKAYSAKCISMAPTLGDPPETHWYVPSASASVRPIYTDST